MSDRPSRFRVSRVALMLLMVTVPVFGPGSSLLLILVTSSMTAYDGLRKGTVYGTAATLIGLELVFGMDVGVLSLSYVVAVMVLLLVSRIITVPSWSLARGWHATDALRTFLIACMLAVIITASSVLIGYLLYGYDDIRGRFEAGFFTRGMAILPIGIAGAVLVLRRIDEPFRRRIIFGT